MGRKKKRIKRKRRTKKSYRQSYNPMFEFPAPDLGSGLGGSALDFGSGKKQKIELTPLGESILGGFSGKKKKGKQKQSGLKIELNPLGQAIFSAFTAKGKRRRVKTQPVSAKQRYELEKEKLDKRLEEMRYRVKLEKIKKAQKDLSRAQWMERKYKAKKAIAKIKSFFKKK